MRGKIAVCDSGVGGVAVLIEIVKKFPNYSYLYISDCKNMPYGNKSKKEIENYALNCIKKAQNWGADLVVIACNTMALNAHEIFEKNCEIPFFYVRPNVQKIIDNRDKKSILFCTEKSAESPDISRLSNNCSCVVIPCKTLAERVEEQVFDLQKVDCSFLSKYSEKYDTVFLGCTHYIFIKDKFAEILKTSEIFDGVEEMICNLQKYLISTAYLKQSFKVKFVGSGAFKMKKVFFHYLKLLK